MTSDQAKQAKHCIQLEQYKNSNEQNYSFLSSFCYQCSIEIRNPIFYEHIDSKTVSFTALLVLLLYLFPIVKVKIYSNPDKMTNIHKRTWMEFDLRNKQIMTPFVFCKSMCLLKMELLTPEYTLPIKNCRGKRRKEDAPLTLGYCPNTYHTQY